LLSLISRIRSYLLLGARKE